MLGVVTWLRTDEAREIVSTAERSEGFLFPPSFETISVGCKAHYLIRIGCFFPADKAVGV
jgi:hypothetical protein